MSKNTNHHLLKDLEKQQQGLTQTTKKTKIVATVGPACSTHEKLLELVKAGVNVFRLNFSHGAYEDKLRIIEYIREINKDQPFNIAILGDLQGPKLRVGDLENSRIELKDGHQFVFTTEKIIGTSERIYVSYPNLAKDVKVGERIFLDDGKMELKAEEILSDTEVRVSVTLGGVLTPKKGVNLPDSALTMPSLTEKDIADLDFIIENNLDWVALSFVRKANDIIELKKRIKDKKSKIKVISKIEMPEALKNIRDIIVESDGIMIARGDLGVEVPVEQVPLIQKEIIRKCMRRAKPVIVATQMMESMMERTKPNRSEVTDVANAVLEGADAVMLSGETAMGEYPTLVVEMMSKIILEVERTAYDYDRDDILTPQAHSPSLLSDALCYSACKLAKDISANALVGMTQSGYTGFILSSYRPKAPLFIFSKEKTLINQLSLSWGVRALFYGDEEGLDNIIFDQVNILKEGGFIKPTDVIVSTGSTPTKLHLPTNTIKITVVE